MFKPISNEDILELEAIAERQSLEMGYVIHHYELITYPVLLRYVDSLKELSKEIRSLDVNADPPQWKVIRNEVYKFHKSDQPRRHHFSGYQDYIREVESIKAEYNYDQLVAERSKWDDSVTSRLAGLRLKRLPVEATQKPSDIFRGVVLPDAE